MSQRQLADLPLPVAEMPNHSPETPAAASARENANERPAACGSLVLGFALAGAAWHATPETVGLQTEILKAARSPGAQQKIAPQRRRQAWTCRPTFMAAGLVISAGFCVSFVDQHLAIAAAGLPPAVTNAAAWISKIASPVFVLPILAVLAALGGRLRQSGGIERARFSGRYMLAAALGAVLASSILKTLVGRARPSSFHGWDPWLTEPLASSDAFASMPSGQSALAAAVTCSAARCFASYRPALLAAGVAICASRVLAGDHWPSDVIAGWMLGWLAALALSRFRYFA